MFNIYFFMFYFDPKYEYERGEIWSVTSHPNTSCLGYYQKLPAPEDALTQEGNFTFMQGYKWGG